MRPVLVTLTLPRKCFFCLKTHDTEQDTTARFGRLQRWRNLVRFRKTRPNSFASARRASRAPAARDRLRGLGFVPAGPGRGCSGSADGKPSGSADGKPSTERRTHFATDGTPRSFNRKSM